MGRRPNQLVGEFFERGEKLEDASNRYQHSCKRCGELFPKGRLDSLMSHLLRRCPNVTPQDRHLVFYQYQQKPEPQKNGSKKRRRTDDFTFPTSQSETDLQFLNNQQRQSALDTLAEVSRRHLDYSSHRPLSTDGQEPEQRLDQLLAEQALMTQLQQHVNALDATPPATHLSSGLAGTQSVALDTSPTNDAPPQSSGLMQTASAATEELEFAQSQTQPLSGTVVDPQLNDIAWLPPLPEHSTQEIDAAPNGISDVSSSSETPTSDTQSLGYLSVPSKEPASGFGVLQRPLKSKSRSRFNDVRRKEVQETRKRGACMRCRMLKKPCSDGTPCKSCRSIESARVWKGTCIRTRLLDQCSLWSTEWFATTTKNAVEGCLDMPSTVVPGSIQVRFCPNSDLHMSFSGRAYSKTLANDSTATVEGSGPESIWLLGEDERLSEKIEEYINQIADEYINNVGSAFMRTTLQQARVVMLSENAEQPSPTKTAEGGTQQPQQPRACYNLQNQLLSDVIHLWMSTQLLSSPAQHFIEISHDAWQEPQFLPRAALQTPPPAETLLPPESPSLIRQQLLAAVETRSSTLSKRVLNELEKRLLQRQHVSRFSTFLASMILLNSIERMAGLYRSMDHEDKATPSSRPFSEYWHQAISFAALLTSLLRIRGLPPAVTRTPHGTLATLPELPQQLLHLRSSGRGCGMKKPNRIDSPDGGEDVSRWLDPLNLSIADLVASRDSDVPGPEESPEKWEMRFIAGVILPVRM